MNALLSESDLLRFGIIVYVGVWLIFVVVAGIYCRRQTLNVNKAARLLAFATVSRHWGWILAIAVWLLPTWVLPDVSVVTQDWSRWRIKAENTRNPWIEYSPDSTRYVNESFFLDQRYALFSYKGRKCDSFKSYLANESDSTLVLYSTVLFNGHFFEVANVSEFKTIGPGGFMARDMHIDNVCEPPMESQIFHVPDSRRDKSVTEWTISLKADAIRDTEDIRSKIKQRKASAWPWLIPKKKPAYAK